MNEAESRWSGWRVGCGVLIVALLLTPVGGWWLWSSRSAAALEVAEQKAEQEAHDAFEPALASLDVVDKETAYDIDKTIRVLNEMNLAMNDQASLQDYLTWSASQDYRGVAPEVLETRREILDILLRLYGKQVEAEDKEAAWEVTRDLILATLSVVEVQGEASAWSPEGGFAVDSEQAKAILQDVKSERDIRRGLQKDIAEIQTELLTALSHHGEATYKYIAEWDQLLVVRDRAYLAAHNGDWEAAAVASELAMKQAPMEREAHLLHALALIEGDNPEDDERIVRELADYIEDHPERSAPALLLIGVQHQRRGRGREAQLALQQSAAYYPKQSQALTDMLDPYESRSWLRDSREGSFIVALYKDTMMGAGYFSPDLQLAVGHFDEGNIEEGRSKVLDHFARRRTQQQWDFVLADIRFCQDLLGPHFWQIFPETTYLDLEVSGSMFSNALTLGVNNRSARTLHNATLVLALHLTDQFPDDYTAVAVPNTVPMVAPNASTSFGNVDVQLAVGDRLKGPEDIVHHRAILIANEAVTWVDTTEFRLKAAKQEEDQQRAAPPESRDEAPLLTQHPQFADTMDRLVQAVSSQGQVELESRYGTDNLMVKLPRELALLRPLFRMQYGDQLYEAQDNVIEGDNIVLRFVGVDQLDGEGAQADDVVLIMDSPFGDVRFDWKADGDVSWRYAGSDQEEEPDPTSRRRRGRGR
jgi:hypothetical protein